MDISDLDFAKEKAMVKDYLDEVVGAKPLSDIFVTRCYPPNEKWYALVAVKDATLAIAFNEGYIRTIGVSQCRGFHSGGSIRIKGNEEEIFDNLLDFFLEDPRMTSYWSVLNCSGSACNSSSANCVMCNNSRKEF